ncbi:hypothetical protein CPB86DRAFT_779531 [Serendipita vermifera]|nr:hypothetical protein CPB86DRAFT_779531 [Serendipita vermifera]
MAALSEITLIVEAILSQLKPGPLSEEVLQGLRHLFSDNLILGALTLIDNEYVSCYILDNGRRHYIVQGSHATSYTIHLNQTSGRPPLCSCYAFIHSVLAMRTHVFCKHILAVRIAIQTERIVERKISEDLLASIITAQVSSA